MEKITKEASVTAATDMVTAEELALINGYAIKPLAADKVFTFSVILCDNELDRDFERFDIPALQKLGELFLGKTGIFDHSAKAKNQTARIYKTELISDENMLTSCGERYTALRAKAYMLRCEKNASLIGEIEAGIKKEVSVGCAVGSIFCSVCGADVRVAPCEHTKGSLYDGKLCHRVLSQPADAYEWSFVAVPAQRNAGVTKTYLKGEDAMQAELLELKSLAEYGRAYKQSIEKDVIRLAFAAKPEIDSELLAAAVQKLTVAEALELKKAFIAEDGCCEPQLVAKADGGKAAQNSQFRI